MGSKEKKPQEDPKKELEDDEEVNEEKLEDRDLTIKKAPKRKRMEKEIIDDSAFAELLKKEKEEKLEIKENIEVSSLERTVGEAPRLNQRENEDSSKDEDPFKYSTGKSNEDKYLKPNENYSVEKISVQLTRDPSVKQPSSTLSRKVHSSLMKQSTSPNLGIEQVEKYIPPKLSTVEEMGNKKNSEFGKTKINYTPSGA